MPSIEWRSKQSFRLTVDLGRDTQGNRIRERKTVRIEDPTIYRSEKKRREFAEAEWYKFKAEVEAGAYVVPEKMFFKDFAEKEWYPKFAEKKYSPANLKNTRSILKAHILPEFGEMRMDAIKTMHCVNFMDKLYDPSARKPKKTKKPQPAETAKAPKPLSSSTILNIYKVLDSIFTKAVEWKLLTENPMEGVERPKQGQWEGQYYDEEEARIVIATLYKEPEVWRLYFLGAMLGGFRRGELTGLEWQDVDFERNLIYVNKSISLTKDGQPVEGDPKKGSKGVVDMPEWYMRELKAYYLKWRKNRLQVGDKWEGGDRQFVFHSGLGKPFHYMTPTGRWSKFLKKYGLKPIRLHDLRHTAATLLIEEGADLKIIQERLRHTRFQTTADLYTHVTKKASKKAAAKLEKLDPRQACPQNVPNSEM